METPLCVFPNYPNPLHILSHTHRDTHKKRHKHTHIHTHFWSDNPPSPFHAYQHSELWSSHTVFPSVLYVKRYTDTHSGHEKFLDLVDGPLEFDLGAVVCVLHCDQDVEVLAEVLPVGLPSVHLLLKHTNSLRKKRSSFLNAPHTTSVLLLRRGNRIFTFLSSLALVLVRPQTTHKAQGCLMQLGRRIKLVEQRAVLQWLHKIGVALNWTEGFALSSFCVTSP